LKSILVTGGCGFIGANFIRFLFEEAGYEGVVVNVDALTYAGNPVTLEDIAAAYPDRYYFVHADINNADAVQAAIEAHGVDTICHFAAESHVDRSIEGPGVFVQTNIVGTHALLELARAYGSQITRFHHVSTDEVFGSLGDAGAFDEETPYDPHSPYSASKAASDHLVRAYHDTYGVPITISNCSNNYGPYHFPEKLIPLMILNAVEGKALPVYGDGLNVRDWLYVVDHCRAIWAILQKGESGRTYCVGGRTEKPNIDVVREICRLVEAKLGPLESGASRDSLITYVKDRPGHDRRYAIDCSRIEAELGWVPLETFESGLARTVDWYLSHDAWVESVRSGAYREWLETCYGGREEEAGA
jgi:dTDP-glucose 4,6-dehydratase